MPLLVYHCAKGDNAHLNLYDLLYEFTYKVNGFYYEFVRTYSQIYCLIFLLILKSHQHILEVDNKFPVRH